MKIALFVLMTALPAGISAQQSNQFLGLGFAGGWVSGGAVPGRPVTGTFSRTAGADCTLTSLAAGPRLTSPYVRYGFRGFTHALAGVSTLKSPDGSTSKSPTFTG